MRSLTSLFIAIIAIVVVSFPTPAASEEETIPCPEGSPRGLICFSPIDIVGDRHSPNAVFVINRGRLVHQRHRNDQTFTDEVIESVDGDPF